MKHWPGSAPSTTPSTATGGAARSIDWSRSSTPAGPRVAAADHLRRPGFAPDLREGHPVCGRRVRRSAATPVRSVSAPAPSALTGAFRTGTITFGMWARTTAGSGKSPARWPASVPLRSISYAPMASRTSAKLSISTPSTSYQLPQLRQATRARILMTRTEWPCVQVIEAAAQRLAIKCDGALPSHLDRPVQLVRMAAEGSLEIVPLEQTAQRVHRRCPAQAGAEGGVQAVALNGDEGDDLLVGGRPCENREQQQMAQAIALSLRAAWIMDSFKRGKQRTKRHQGDLHQLRTSLQQIRYRTLRALPLGRVGSGRRGRTA